MASIEEDALRDMYRMVRMILSKLNRRRNSKKAQRMSDPRTREGSLLEELRELIEEIRDEQRNNPELRNATENLSEDQRAALFEAEARRIQENRDRLDNDPNLTPEALEREREAEEQRDRDRDDNGIDDERDRFVETGDIIEERRDPDHNGQDNAVEDRQADREARDAEERAKLEEQRREEDRRTEEARGGDVTPAVAAAGATAVVADEVLEEVEEQRQDQQAVEDQERDESEVLNEDGTAPEVIGETDQERDDRLAEPEAVQEDRILNEDGTAPEVIGETDQERDDRLAEPEAAQEDRILDEDGAAPAVIGEDAQQAGLDQEEVGQDRILDEDGAAPAVIGEDAQQTGLDQEQDGQEQGQDQAGAGGGLQVRGPDGQEVPREADGSINGQTFTISRQESQADGLSQDGQRPPDPLETNLAQARAENGRSSVTAGRVGDVEINGQLPDGQYRANEDGSMSYRGTTENGQQVDMNVGAGSKFGDGGKQLSDAEVTRLRDFQQGDHAPAAGATQRPAEPVGAGVGGKTAGGRSAELRAEKSPSVDGGRGRGE